ncbi:MAG TPA: STAS domain-containing protein [Steroidobacteraceae bacterium]|jgi:phospholipid transport system transporter-binding protein|nr:STAS domain-containing protein [Steroidobacteraceae bacterium]
MNAAAKYALVEASPGVYRVEGPLTFASVPSLQANGARLVRSATGALTFDLHSVSAIDSAGLALLIDWLAEAKALSRSLKYDQLPETLVALARLSDVEELIAA